MNKRYAMRLFVSLAASVVLFIAASRLSEARNICSTGTCVLTWQYDNHRSGQNLSERTLLPTNLTTSNFGQLCSLQLDGQVYAQPLVATNVTINGAPYSSVAYVVTENDTVYAINGTPPGGGRPCAVISSRSLLPPSQYPADCHYIGNMNCTTIAPYVGILSTPVITINPSTNKGTMYVVTETQDVPSGAPGNWYHYLHAIDIATLTEKTGSPVRINPPHFSPEAASSWSRKHIQRPGLLSASGYVYIAFSMMDGNAPRPNGSVFGYSTGNLRAEPLYFATTVDGLNLGGGVWQGGSGLAYGLDKSPSDGGQNFIYFNTGDGIFDADFGGSNYGNSFIKLKPSDLSLADYFTPADQYYRSCALPHTDLDFGSGGVMLIPDNKLTNPSYLAVTGDKEGGIWFIDRGSPGKHNSSLCSPSCSSACSVTASQNNVQTYWTGTPNAGPEFHNNAAFWRTPTKNYIYMAPAVGALTQYSLCTGSQPPICSGATQQKATDVNATSAHFANGTTPSVSAASTTATDGIVWAMWADGSTLTESGHPAVGVLYAFDAVSMAFLYKSSGTGSPCPAKDALTVAATKFSVPTVANGFVYLGEQGPVAGTGNAGMFYIFGLNRSCQF